MKFSLFVRNFHISPQLEEVVNKAVVETDKVTPGQIRKKGPWYYLTFLRVVKIRNFKPAMWDLEETEVNCIRHVAFQWKDGKLLVNGGKLDLKEIAEYLEAQCQPLNPKKDEVIDLKDFFNIDTPIVDLAKQVESLENIEAIAAIPKVRLKGMQVTLGSIGNCVVTTSDYGAVTSLMKEEENGVFGFEAFLKKPADTSVYYDLEGLVRVNAKDPDTNVEDIAVAFALKLR